MIFISYFLFLIISISISNMSGQENSQISKANNQELGSISSSPKSAKSENPLKPKPTQPLYISELTAYNLQR